MNFVCTDVSETQAVFRVQPVFAHPVDSQPTVTDVAATNMPVFDHLPRVQVKQLQPGKLCAKGQDAVAFRS